jgi:hypothetical protein
MKWIKCSERLPENVSNEYLVLTESGFCIHTWKEEKITLTGKKTHWVWDNCIQESYDHPYPCGKETHWMPLPFLPKD